MPARKEQTVEEENRVEEQVQRDRTETLLRQVRAMVIALAFILAIPIIALQIQVSSRNRDINTVKSSVETLDTAADKSYRAAQKASDDLAAAIKAAQGSGQAEATQTALQEIHSILVIVQNLQEGIANLIREQR